MLPVLLFIFSFPPSCPVFLHLSPRISATYPCSAAELHDIEDMLLPDVTTAYFLFMENRKFRHIGRVVDRYVTCVCDTIVLAVKIGYRSYEQ